MTTANILSQLGSPGVSTGFKNRIINGAMNINQRGGTATVNSSNGVYSVDRWIGRTPNSAGVFTLQQSSTAPTGFNNSLLATVTTSATPAASDIYFIQQRIEGYNVADLAYGTASAKTVTLSFWVQSSLTGTFGGSIGNNVDQSYPFNFTISSANTWTQISVTIAGSTTGTWNTTNGQGLLVSISMGSGSSVTGTANTWGNYPYAPTGSLNVIATSGATFYITGVQLEVGTTATNFDYRAYSTELALCQRYFETSYENTKVPTNLYGPSAMYCTVGTNTYGGGASTNQQVIGPFFFKVNKRSAPTLSVYSYTSSTLTAVSNGWTGADFSANSGATNIATQTQFSIYNLTGSNITTGGYAVLFHYAASAEL